MKFSKDKLIKPLIVIMAITLIFTYGLPWITTMQIGKTTANISIAFKGAGNGLDPQGNRFDINELKSDEVLTAAISKSGLKGKISTEQLKTRIEILPEVNADTLKELLTLTRIEGKTQDIKERMVYPTSFTIGLKDRGLPSYFSEKKLLNNILKAYTEHMESKYLADTASEPAYSKKEILNMDYPEMMKVLNQEAEGLIRYIGFYAKNEPQYVSEKTGISFNDIYQQAMLIKDTDIGNMRSLVNYYKLTNNAQNRIKYEETLLKRAAVVANKLQGTELTTSEIITIYDNSSNFVFTSGDNSAINLAPLENQFYSELMNALVKKQTSYIDAKYNQQDILRAIEKLQNGVVSEEEQSKAASQIKEGTKSALDKIEQLKNQTMRMAKEFYDTNVNSKITISRSSYHINTLGNVMINFIIVIAIAVISPIIYQKLRSSSYGKYLDLLISIFRKKNVT